ncbi:MAG: hypothetical protein ACFCUL_00910, partial [Flavobacteriaceae bacterium]
SMFFGTWAKNGPDTSGEPATSIRPLSDGALLPRLREAIFAFNSLFQCSSVRGLKTAPILRGNPRPPSALCRMALSTYGSISNA